MTCSSSVFQSQFIGTKPEGKWTTKGKTRLTCVMSKYRRYVLIVIEVLNLLSAEIRRPQYYVTDN